MAVVVFPTPPFWFVIAYTFDTDYIRTFHPTISRLQYLMLADCKHIVTNATFISN
jgi:hypothetical protein